MRYAPPVRLANATAVTHDAAVDRSLSFANGHVTCEDRRAHVIDLRDHLVFPGLINAHDHLQLNNIPPLPHAAPFGNSYQWIDAFADFRRCPEVAAAVATPVDVRHWQGGLKNLLSGATSVAHHDPRHPVLEDKHFPVGLVLQFGWCHSLGLGLSRDGAPPQYGPLVHESFLTTPRDQPWIIHLAEGTDDLAAREAAELDDLGCLAPNTVIVHGVGLTSHDISLAIMRGASVVWCPSSNLEMFGRTLDPQRLFNAGLLALGTDSRLTGSRDLLDELRVAAANSELSARELLRLVTTGASAILRLPKQGGLDAGQVADCVVVRESGDPWDALLDTRRAGIRAVIRGGAPVVADPDFADWFDYCGVETVDATLDGRPKLLARHSARSDAVVLEPGLEIAQ